jgi:hypothetical protein
VDVKIYRAKFDSYFFFMQGAKSANSELFKDFCNEAERRKNREIGAKNFDIHPKPK